MPNILRSSPIDIDLLLSRGRLEIPQYQRSYSWTNREITEFLEDLYGAVQHTESWFLGIIYTYNSQDETTHARRLTSLLLDGQQRMTTLFILLKELTLYYEILPDFDVADLVKNYSNATLTSLIFETGTDTPRLKLDEANRDQFAEYLRGGTREEATFNYYQNGEFAKSHELLNKAITVVREWLDKDFDQFRGHRDELENFKRLVRFIISGIELIEIQLDNHASFYNIFENINDRGRRLSDSDKFKNRFCSLIPKNQIPQFESDWFETAKGIYGLKKDFDKDLFGFYFRSTGINDLEQGGFYRTLRKKVQELKGQERTTYIAHVWEQVKEMLRLIKVVNSMDLLKLYQGTPGPKTRAIAKVVNVLVRDSWRCFDQYGVIAYGLFFSFNRRNDEEAYLEFLRDLVNGVRFYVGAFLLGEGANTIRDYTIDIAKGLKQGRSLDDILAENNRRLDFGSRFNATPLDRLNIPNNDVSRLLLTLVQAHVNRELIEHYDANQSWTLEHLLPKGWEQHWSSIGTSDWVELNNHNQGRLFRKLQAADLDSSNKFWIQQFLGNKLVLSWKQNNDVKNDGLAEKKTRILGVEGGVVMPTLPGFNLYDYETFGLQEILDRTEAIGSVLSTALAMKELP